jgi:tubulin-specific chaperone D
MKNFKHGISILTAADYYAIGNRVDAFTKIAFHVAQYQEYRRKIVKHVHTVKLQHWDEVIRTLASKSLHGLVTMDQTYVIEVVFPALLETSLDPKNIPIRHGSILGLAEAIHALGELDGRIEDIVPENLLQQISELVPTIEKLRLYRGRGGEMVRGAVCRFIQCLCEAKVPLIARQQVRSHLVCCISSRYVSLNSFIVY